VLSAFLETPGNLPAPGAKPNLSLSDIVGRIASDRNYLNFRRHAALFDLVGGKNAAGNGGVQKLILHLTQEGFFERA